MNVKVKKLLSLLLTVTIVFNLVACDQRREIVIDTEEKYPEKVENKEEQQNAPSTIEPKEESGTDSQKFEWGGISIGRDLVITEAKSYAGIFFEDGSDEIVSDVLMLIVANNGDQTIQLADFSVLAEDRSKYNFRITTLLPGCKTTVLESSRAPYSKDIHLISASMENLAVFPEEPNLCEDMLSFEYDDYLIKVKNISDREFTGGRVGYKNAASDLYIGGITYTVSIPTLAVGEETALSARHFVKETSKLVFVTHAE